MSRPVAALAAGLVLLVPTAPAWAQEADTATVTTTVDEPVDDTPDVDCTTLGPVIDAEPVEDEPLPDGEPVVDEPVDEEPAVDEPVEDEPLVDASDTSTADLDDVIVCSAANAGGGAPQLPLSGPSDVLLTAALGTSLVLAGAGAVAVGRRRGRHELA